MRCETAELFFESDGGWDAWNDLPVRFFFEGGGIAALAWRKFDDLWLADDLSLPFDVAGSTVRWVPAPFADIVVGRRLRSVWLAPDWMTWGDAHITIWIHLLLGFGDGWLDVSNGCDENKYGLPPAPPAGAVRVLPAAESVGG